MLTARRWHRRLKTISFGSLGVPRLHLLRGAYVGSRVLLGTGQRVTDSAVLVACRGSPDVSERMLRLRLKLMLSKASPEHLPLSRGLCVLPSPLWSGTCLHPWGNKSKPSQSFSREPAVGASDSC